MAWTQTRPLNLGRDVALLTVASPVTQLTCGICLSLSWVPQETTRLASLGSWDTLADVVLHLPGLPASVQEEVGQAPPLSLEVILAT